MIFLLDKLGYYGYWINKDYNYGYTGYNILLARDINNKVICWYEL